MVCREPIGRQVLRWGGYRLAVQPSENYTKDRPQMAVLEKYTVTDPK